MEVKTRLDGCSIECYYDFGVHKYICKCGKYEDDGRIIKERK